MKLKYLVLVLFSGMLLGGCTLRKEEKSGLQIITGEESASVFIDGSYLEKSPLIQKDLKPGEYLIRIQPDNPQLVSYETPVTLKPGLLTVLTWEPGQTSEVSGGVLYEMEKLNKNDKSEVTFISIPDGVIISMDGGDKQIAPLTLTEIEPGQHEFEATLPSYEVQKHTINVVAGYRMIITIKLAKNDVMPSPEPSPTVKPTPTDTDTPTTQDSQATDGEMVKISSTSFFQDGEEVLRVRDAAGGSGKELGFAKVGESYTYLSETKNGWYKIQFEEEEGWVSGKYSELE
jgi:uncharacterized protein YgiM (DUF1202 family)